MATLFDTLYNASEEIKAGLKKPFVSNKVKRGFDASVDNLESKKLDLQEKADGLRGKIANGQTDLIPDLLDAIDELNDVTRLAALAAAEGTAFFTQVTQ